MKKSQGTKSVKIERTIASGLEAVVGAERDLAARLRETSDEELSLVAGGQFTDQPKWF
jgi:hypothetical protein